MSADGDAGVTATGAERASAAAAVAGARRVVAAGHLPLDGDGLGSALGLVHSLRAAGRSAVVLVGEAPPRNLRFLPGLGSGLGPEPDHAVVVRHPDPLPFEPDLFVALDGGGADRFGDMLPTDGTPILNLDHHVTNERFGTLDWVDPSSASTGLMVYELLRDLGLPIDLPAAECLYTTLVTDTGRFSYSNTSTRAHEVAADLLRCGVQPDRVLLHVFRSRTIGQLRLASQVLDRLQTDAGGRLAWSEVTLKMCRESRVDPTDAHDLIDYPMSLDGVELGMLFREQDGEAPAIHVSLRSNGGVDVARFAIENGGGGHPRAAGFSSPTPLERLRPSVIAAAKLLLGDGS